MRAANAGVRLRDHPLKHPVRITLVLLVVLTQLPFLVTIWYSLHRWNLTTPETRAFIGLENYQRVFETAGFWPAVFNSVKMTAGTVAVVLLGGLALALMVNRTFRTRGLARTLLFAPFLIPPSAAALMWKTGILDARAGLLGWVLSPFGLESTDWVNRWPMVSVIIVAAWQWTPFAMIILLAGLQSIKDSAREAALIDGANAWQTFRWITLPHLRPYIEIAGLLSAIFTAQMIDPIVLMTQGGPGDATTTLPFLLYNTAFRGFDIGLASAMGVIVVIATVVTVMAIVRLTISIFREEM